MFEIDPPTRAKRVSYIVIAIAALFGGLMSTLSVLLDSGIPALITFVVALIVLGLAFMKSLGTSEQVRRIEARLRTHLELETESFVGLVSIDGEKHGIAAIAIHRRVLVVLHEGLDRPVEFPLQSAEVEVLPMASASQARRGLTIDIHGSARIQYSPLTHLWTSRQDDRLVDEVCKIIEKAAAHPSQGA